MILRRRSPFYFLLPVLAFGLIVAPAGTQSPRKLRIAVLDFDYTDIRNSASAFFGSSIDVGKGISNVLAADLDKEGTFSVVSQAALEGEMADENFSDLDRNDPGSAAKLGRVLHADAIIIGTVTQFDTGLQDNDTGEPNPDATTHVRIEARVVDVESGQIQEVADGSGESSGSTAILLGGWKGWGRENVNFASSDFQQTVMGKSIKAAVDQLGSNLVMNASKTLRTAARRDGIVAAVDGGQVVLNIGSVAGIMPGDVLEAFRVTKEIKDPSTGEIIRQLTTTVGVIKTTDVDAKSSVCTVVSGSGFQVGDRVRAAQ
jgi:curli biogenesis system outer membrane secretion channel CsgG